MQQNLQINPTIEIVEPTSLLPTDIWNIIFYILMNGEKDVLELYSLFMTNSFFKKQVGYYFRNYLASERREDTSSRICWYDFNGISLIKTETRISIEDKIAMIKKDGPSRYIEQMEVQFLKDYFPYHLKKIKL